jgi:hypothetical protein
MRPSFTSPTEIGTSTVQRGRLTKMRPVFETLIPVIC